MTTEKKQNRSPRPGETITGKWNGHRYKVLRTIGRGATGTVYLAERRGKKLALKISDQGYSVTAEVNVLQHFSRMGGSKVGPDLIDVDDWLVGAGGQPVPFYVMEYISGEPFLGFLQSRESFWLGVLVVQLLSDLDKLHNAGWVFGDLKPDNLKVMVSPPRVRLLDVGGTTKIGRAIKEFTEFYDRGFWSAGTRKAEPSYDVFAVGMIMLHALYGRRFRRQPGDDLNTLKARVQRLNSPYEPIIIHALSGKYVRAMDMQYALTTLMSTYAQEEKKRQSPKSQPQSPPLTQTRAGRTRVKAKATKKKRIHPFKRVVQEVVWIGVLLVAFYVCMLLLGGS
ncbi:protein kinase domain-containing protein [Aureibacillus halotolerans]|uniref:Serine/threonine-protein kinase n=1 Tax=Aureibacillus halotolerans TaxID=1508390 RepID=A0A4R6TTI2_9BACI|nr:protein kinase family protein [Aureibacillus halotolerans]TDQ34214.1 serine/threonine-protein kinase [Aureibacillus halotolerans]